MILLQDVSKAYAGSKNYSVHGISFEAKAGEICGFLGPNGAGKTTTLKMMTGILKPTSGKIEVCGLDIVKEPIKAKQHIGFVSDDHAIFENLSGRDYLNFISDIYGVPVEERKARIEKLATVFNIIKDLDNLISTYSHGMKQKTAVMSALVHQPDVWILDEPLLGLDPQSAFEMKQMMRDHADSGHAVLFSTHILEVAEKICDRLIIINRGRILTIGTLAELKATYGDNLEEAFLKMVEEDNLKIKALETSAASVPAPKN